MNKKVLGLLAASAAVIGSAILAAPARAVEQTVDVNLTVDEVLFLRTFQSIDLKVSQGDLSGGTEDKDYDPRSTDGTLQIDVDSPTNVNDIAGGETVTKEVRELYAVWGNGDVDSGDVTVTVRTTPGGDMLTGGSNRDPILAKMTVGPLIDTERDIDDLEEDSPGLLRVGGVELTFDFEDEDGEIISPQAGAYIGGSLTVEATTIGN